MSNPPVINPPFNDFRLPKVIARLVQAINEGAAAAQRGAFLFGVLGLYLVATALSISDYDVLRHASTSIAQIDVRIPIVVSFAVAPILFVIVHAFTLTRYNLLARELRAFEKAVLDQYGVHPQDETQPGRCAKHCYMLLSNVEFIETFMRRQGRRPNDPGGLLFPFLAWGLLIVFPVLALYLIEISALRLQNISVTRTQQFALIADLLLMLWFLRRVRYGRMTIKLERTAVSNERSRPKGFGDKLLERSIIPAFFPTIVLAILAFPMLWWAEIPASPGSALAFQTNTILQGRKIRDRPPNDGARKDRPQKDEPQQDATSEWSNFWRQPLDLVLCPNVQFGCRYLDVEGRTLAGGNTTGPSSLNLADRTLRYADFRDVTADGVNFRGADLSHATFESSSLIKAHFDRATLRGATLRRAKMWKASFKMADMSRADLGHAELQDADLGGADLSHARMFQTDLEGATLKASHLQGATLFNADLAGASLRRADLTFAFLGRTDLAGADLRNAYMPGAYMVAAHMQGIDLRGATLVAADLSDADLMGADLSGAWLDGATLTSANLEATDLGGAKLFHASIGRGAKIKYADMGGADTITPLPEEMAKKIVKSINQLHLYPDFISAVVARVNSAAEPPNGYRKVKFAKATRAVFVEAYPQAKFPDLPPKDVMCGLSNESGSQTICPSAPSSDGSTASAAVIPLASRPADRAVDSLGGRTQFLASARYYDTQLKTFLVKGKDAKASAASAKKEYAFALERRALEESSDDDPNRNNAIACAADYLAERLNSPRRGHAVRPAASRDTDRHPNVPPDVIGKGLKGTESKLAGLCARFKQSRDLDQSPPPPQKPKVFGIRGDSHAAR